MVLGFDRLSDLVGSAYNEVELHGVSSTSPTFRELESQLVEERYDTIVSSDPQFGTIEGELSDFGEFLQVFGPILIYSEQKLAYRKKKHEAREQCMAKITANTSNVTKGAKLIAGAMTSGNLTNVEQQKEKDNEENKVRCYVKSSTKQTIISIGHHQRILVIITLYIKNYVN